MTCLINLMSMVLSYPMYFNRASFIAWKPESISARGKSFSNLLIVNYVYDFAGFCERFF